MDEKEEKRVCEFCGKRIPKSQRPLYQKNKKTGEMKVMCEKCFSELNHMEYKEFQKRKKRFTMGVYGLVACVVAILILLYKVL